MARINTNIPSVVAQSNLNRTQKELSLRFERLSTGLKHQPRRRRPRRAHHLRTLRSDIQGVNTGMKNAERASSVIADHRGALRGQRPPQLHPLPHRRVRQHRRQLRRGTQRQPAPDRLGHRLDHPHRQHRHLRRPQAPQRLAGLHPLRRCTSAPSPRPPSGTPACVKQRPASRSTVDVVASAQTGALYYNGTTTPGRHPLGHDPADHRAQRGVQESPFPPTRPSTSSSPPSTTLSALHRRPGRTSSTATPTPASSVQVQRVRLRRLCLRQASWRPARPQQRLLADLQASTTTPQIPTWARPSTGPTLRRRSPRHRDDTGRTWPPSSTARSPPAAACASASTRPPGAELTPHPGLRHRSHRRHSPSYHRRRRPLPARPGRHRPAAGEPGHPLHGGLEHRRHPGSTAHWFLSSLKTGQGNSIAENVEQQRLHHRQFHPGQGHRRGLDPARPTRRLREERPQTNVRSSSPSFENLSASQSQIRDADFAQETSSCRGPRSSPARAPACWAWRTSRASRSCSCSDK
jgi:hypothetical protein